MASAWFRFYEELNDFLSPARRKVKFQHAFGTRTSVKDMIEALGVPHTEVELILVNGGSVDFSHIVQDGDQISVYPVFEAMDITPLISLRPQPLRVSRFVVDVHLGRLARYLRMLGFDTLYQNSYDDAELARISSQQRRILLTRDQGLLKYSIVTHGYYVRETRPRRQLQEVVARLDLYRTIQAFRRCTQCNGLLEAVPKEQVLDRLESNTQRYFEHFWICGGCRRIYWKGSHYQPMQRLIEDLQRHHDTQGQ